MRLAQLLFLGFFPLLFLNCFNSNRENESKKELSKTEVKMDELIRFIGCLLEVPPPTERCGDNAIAVVFKFKVVQMLNGEINSEYILLIIPCPELKGENFFVKDQKYRIEATRDSPEAKNYAVVNEYPNENFPMLLATQIEKEDNSPSK